MKCIQNIVTEHIRRLPNAEAEKLVLTGFWHYVGKVLWKAVGRP